MIDAEPGVGAVRSSGESGGVARANYGKAVSQDQIERAAPRFWAKVVKAIASECWLWTGAVSGRGYGCLAVDRGDGQYYKVGAHKVSFALANGYVPAAPDVVHHTCAVPLCVNPAHLEHVTKGEHQQHHIGLAESKGLTVTVTLDPETADLCAALMDRHQLNRSATVRAGIHALAADLIDYIGPARALP